MKRFITWLKMTDVCKKIKNTLARNLKKQIGQQKRKDDAALFTMQPCLRCASALLSLIACALTSQVAFAQATYNVGAGISDVTGAAAEIGMLGYAQLQQKTSGIHQRLRARAFIAQDPATGKSVVLAVVDAGMLTQAVQQAVLARLQNLYGTQYTAQNVMLVATHTHSGPGGFSYYALYNITILGFQAPVNQRIH